MDPARLLPESTTSREPDAAVEVWDLEKVYRTGFWMHQKVASLQGCSLRVRAGETFGLLGPNGAGKTTLMKVLLGIVRPTKGRGVVLGCPLGDREVRQHLGYLPENPYFYNYLTGWEVLEFTAGLFGIFGSERRQRIRDLLDWVGLSQATARKKQLGKYSKGMLQRVGMAQALINNPDMVFLDEPMSGLDPLGRRQMREIILSLREQGKTVFFNSHILGDVEQICDRVALLADGKILCTGALDELLGASGTYHVRGKEGNLEVLKQWLPDITFEDNYWHGTLQGDFVDFLASAKLINATLLQMHIARPSLEEFFVEQLQQQGITSSQ